MDMNCTRLEDWLADAPDASDLPAEWVHHVAECSTCAQRWQDERRLTAAIAVWRANPPRPPSPSALVETLLAEVAARPNTVPVSKRHTRRTPWWPMVAASVALAVVGIGLMRLTSPNTPDSWTATTSSPDDTQQLALTSTVGTLISQLDGT